ncbi:hypothetical protein HGM15179_019009 [Zosterops borbonicus]|uniref:Reverse transcriptase thumb domain-containing protein n=1 Tax=Zosterops borbonicus TaxID=364589 RepID=A0A8K1DAG7_9PASS|nr:hypothetical protein HGM15179_019009 [Zosterops borbonicus]
MLGKDRPIIECGLSNQGLKVSLPAVAGTWSDVTIVAHYKWPHGWELVPANGVISGIEGAATSMGSKRSIVIEDPGGQIVTTVLEKAIKDIEGAGFEIVTEKGQCIFPWTYLGLWIGERTITPQQLTIKDNPRTLRDLQQLCGSINWIDLSPSILPCLLQQGIPNYSKPVTTALDNYNFPLDVKERVFLLLSLPGLLRVFYTMLRVTEDIFGKAFQKSAPGVDSYKWHGMWEDMGQYSKDFSPPMVWKFTPKQLQDPNKDPSAVGLLRVEERQTALEKNEAPEHLMTSLYKGNTAEKIFEEGEKIILNAGIVIKQNKVKTPAQEIQLLGVNWKDGQCQNLMDVVNKIAAMSPLTSKKDTCRGGQWWSECRNLLGEVPLEGCPGGTGTVAE